ncbi:glutamate-5-semialdehyde dehydrogenase [Pyruvatibacter sp.]|uniref:glutamate-5-semialdehyde dehydrogenase n=1 Tax=Pyruvatibacter sp. TaxID=1981328 RepID=UPI0032EB7174
MSVVKTLHTAGPDVVATMAQLGRNAREAAKALRTAPRKQKDAALLAAAMTIRADVDLILDANAKDMEAAKARGLTGALIDRLMLDDARIEAMAKGLEAIVALDDPVGTTITEWDMPSGLHIERRRVPLGVIGIIYESRPNVTADAGALCLKSGNAVILRGGSESFHSSRAIHTILEHGLDAAQLPSTAIQLVPTTDRAAVGEMLKGLDGTLDLLVPRGGRSLTERVTNEARVPVLGHLDGLCHVYIDKDADMEMAKKIAVNAKMRRTGICGAAETLLVDEAVAATHLPAVATALKDAGCELRGDDKARALMPDMAAATDDDWRTEYLDAIITVAVVPGVKGALDHIAKYGSQHTESIVTDNQQTADTFLTQCDSAILLHNASTQFADGGEFGMGAEIGIATGKLHARGPVGLEQLTTFKYVVRGSGQTRP